MKVLIIDDSPDALDIARARLVREGLEICCADSGRAGLEMAKREGPDLILLDVHMPDVSGFDVCRRLKADLDLCMIPIIFLTAADRSEDRVKGLDIGAVDYVTKPFDAFELRARVQAALRTKHLQDLLIQYAHIDPLTGLGNRRALTERLGQEWARIQRHGGSLAFIMADVDHFKRINDSHGHNVGDRLLCEIAKAIQNQCREVDCPARYGGEEFAIIVPDETAEGAARLAERCRLEIESACVDADSGHVRTTASFGVSDSASARSDRDLASQADRALYQAKDGGRNRVAVADAGEADASLAEQQDHG